MIGLAVLMAFGLLLAAGLALRPAADQGVALAREWSDRVSSDYPTYKAVGFGFNTFTDSDGTRTTYVIKLVPAGRDFSVGVTYVSAGEGEPESTDEVLRQMGGFHDREFSLLDYLKANYVSKGKSVTVSTDPDSDDGIEIVEWTQHRQFGPFRYSSSDSDRLEYDQHDMDWAPLRVDAPPADQ